jgi:hypothetical protein
MCPPCSISPARRFTEPPTRLRVTPRSRRSTRAASRIRQSTRAVEQLGPWFLHHYEVRDPADLEDPELHALMSESYHLMGEQGRLTRT